MKDVLQPEKLQQLVYVIRGYKVMLDQDLARLYHVRTKELNKAVARNRERFPADFMFRLSESEHENLKFQIGTSSSSHGGRRYLPFVFTEQGVAMLSSVLRSKQSIQVNIMIMRAFVRIRQLVSLNRVLAKRLASIERRLTGHDADVQHLYKLIQDLSPVPEKTPEKRPIGF